MKQWSTFFKILYAIGCDADVTLPIRVEVDAFRRHKWIHCMSPTHFPWVAANAHLLYHTLSDVSVSTSECDMTSEWVLAEILSGESTDVS